MQIVDWVCDKVLSHELQPDEQIPSVRDIAVELAVNPNTVMRSIERLLQQGIIYSQRGRGNYLSADAYERVMAMRRQRLLDEMLPQLAREVRLLEIPMEEIVERLSNAGK